MKARAIRPRSIYQHSDIFVRSFQDQLLYLMVFPLFPSLRSMLEYWYIERGPLGLTLLLIFASSFKLHSPTTSHTIYSYIDIYDAIVFEGLAPKRLLSKLSSIWHWLVTILNFFSLFAMPLSQKNFAIPNILGLRHIKSKGPSVKMYSCASLSVEIPRNKFVCLTEDLDCPSNEIGHHVGF